MIDRERLVRLFLELVRIDSPSGHEAPCTRWVKEHLEGMGYSALEEQGNLIVRVPGTVRGPRVLFSAHLDTVSPGEGIVPIVVNQDGSSAEGFPMDALIRSEGETILGSDDKAGVAALLELLRVLREDHLPHPPLRIVFSIGEEVGLKGSKSLSKAILDADMGYVLDASGKVGTLITSAPAQDSIAVTVHGRAAHAGIAPEAGLSAIIVAGHILSKLPLGRIDEETTANIGKIEGGVATNIVPDRLEMRGEARSRSLEKLDAQVARMQDVILETAEQFGATAEIEVERVYPNFTLPDSAPVVQAFIRAAKKAGLAPTTQGAGGGSDGNILNSYGIPTAVLSMGWQKIHTTAEEIAVGDLIRIAELVRSIIDTCGEEATW